MTPPWNGETAAAGTSITIYDITNLRDLVNTTVPEYYSIADNGQNQLDDVYLFNWSEKDESMFADYSPEKRK